MAKGQGSQLAKVDSLSAYRNIPVHPEDWNLLGMVWENSLFIDTTLPFGLRSAPKIFIEVADAAEWIARQPRGDNNPPLSGCRSLNIWESSISG